VERPDESGQNTDLSNFFGKKTCFSQKRMNTGENLVKRSCIHFFLKIADVSDTHQNARLNHFNRIANGLNAN